MFFDTYDTPVFRPPSEARSFILRVTRGCAHNKCTYCNMYRGVPFQILKDEEIDPELLADPLEAAELLSVKTYNRDSFCPSGSTSLARRKGCRQ